ncbi:hypothetical protein [Corynebacterium halotolerans]|nr:hypothetical protein [Corynebacterium halotolerans]
MSDSDELAKLTSQATNVDRLLQELLVRRRSVSAGDLPNIDYEIDRARTRAKMISERAGAITVRQLEEELQQARAEAAPDGPRMDMGKLVRALDRALGWRRDESCYIEDGTRKLPRLRVVAAWDDGSFIHFVIHVLAGAQEGFLGYCYEDGPSRWSWRVTDVEAQEVNVLSDQWFYGENLVLKIEGAAEEEILWQYPVPDKPLPVNTEELRSMDLGPSAWISSHHFPAV